MTTVTLVTGHLIDGHDRLHPRFPVEKAKAARSAIATQVVVRLVVTKTLGSWTERFYNLWQSTPNARAPGFEIITIDPRAL